MSEKKRHYLDLDLKFQIGHIVVNVLYINYEPPTPSWNYDNHAHSSYELHFIPSGYGLLRVGKEKYRISPGTFYLTGPGLYHQQEADPEEPMCEYCINFELKHTKKRFQKYDLYLHREIDEIAAAFQKTNFWFGEDKYSLKDLCIDMMEEIDTRDLGCHTCIQNLVSQLIVKTARCLSDNSHTEMALPKKITNDRRRFIADQFFQLNVSPNPNVLAGRLGVSIRQLNRIMLDYYSMTFKEKLANQRVEYAKNLLLSTGWSVNKISEKTGYTNVGYFCKIFKAIVHETPSEFRKRFSS